MTTVVAVRHGETDWNRDGRMQGWAPTPLNERGREQAAAAGEWLAREYDVDRVFSSDLLRCEQTTAGVLESIGDPPVGFEPHWRERHLGVYQGLTYADVQERFPDFGLGESAYEAAMAVPESGESLRDLADRVTRRFREVVAEHSEETVLVITHGGPLHVLLGYAKDMPLRDGLKSHHQQNCAVNEFDVRTTGSGDEEIAVVRENATPWE